MAFMPPVGEVTIGPFSADMAPFLYQPKTAFRAPLIHIGLASNSADVGDVGMQSSLAELMMWAVKPPSEETLRALYAEGKRATRCYLNDMERERVMS